MYRFVVWHKGRKAWVAQVPDGNGGQKTVGNVHSCQHSAAKAICKYFGDGTTPAALRLPSSPGAKKQETRASQWTYVYWHFAKQLWEARVAGKTLGYFSTSQSAAEQARLRAVDGVEG